MKKDKNKKQSFKKESFFWGIIVICCALIFVVYILLNQYSIVLDEQVKTKAELYASDSAEPLNEIFDDVKILSLSAAEKMSTIAQLSDGRQIISDMMASDPYIKYIYFSQGGSVFDADHTSYDISSNHELSAMAQKKELSVSGIFTDPNENQHMIAVFAPVSGSEIMDGIFLFYSAGALKNLKQQLNPAVIDTASFIAFCDSEGNIIDMMANRSQIVSSNTNLFDSIRHLTNNKGYVDEIRRIISSGERESIPMQINGEVYAVSVVSSDDNNAYCIIGLYEADEIYKSGYDMISVIMTSIFVIQIIIVIFSLYFILSNKNIKAKIEKIGTYNKKLACATQLGFEKEAQEIISRHKGSSFAVVMAEIGHFNYIMKENGEEYVDNILLHINRLISRFMRLGETYGYVSHGRYVLLCHYRNKEKIVPHLHKLYMVVYESELPKKHFIKLRFGISLQCDRKSNTVRTMIENASAAIERVALSRSGENFIFYDDTFTSDYMNIANLELRMEQALLKNEFQVYYQPKLNVEGGYTDGSEALVRWYIPETNTYFSPEVFLPLFESNGFVSKIDRFVIKSVCELMEERVSKGYHVFPVSVNVSYFTALEPDFVEYFSGIKRKYNIPDGFITVEFTESAAFEDYNTMKNITDSLRENGFLCAIDDFGKGYSSYNLLKIINIDEIKLDVFFSKQVLSDQKARDIIESVVCLAKKMKIKVTQEGVEDRETFEYLQKIGCDVVQGFYYSKPLCKQDFIKFTEMQSFDSELTPSNMLLNAERRVGENRNSDTNSPADKTT